MLNKVKDNVDMQDTKSLDAEFSEVVTGFNQYHNDMDQYRRYYINSAFYPRKKGQSQVQSRIEANLLKVFADKNMHYTSPFPRMKVPSSSNPDEEARRYASISEKIIHATHELNHAPMNQKKFSFDNTIFSVSVNELMADRKNRRVIERRLDPRYCFWQLSEDNEMRIVAFWVAYPMTKDQIQKQFGVTPTTSSIEPDQFTTQTTQRIDNKDWFYVVKRIDAETRVTWVGEHFLEKAHKHLLGCLPIDINMPFFNADQQHRGDFYLRQLVPLQAEYNETLRRRANIVRRLGNPAVWARGVYAQHLDEVKSSLSGDGGFVGLKNNGELGVLSIPETAMVDNHLQDVFQQMKYISGFGNASFGESVGANTSGDALSMYYAPTTRAVQDQNVNTAEFWRSINTKILIIQKNLMRAGETIKLNGYKPRGTLLSMDDEYGTREYDSGSYSVEFTRDDIQVFNNVVTTEPATPKDELAYKRLIMEMMNTGALSKITGWEEIGILNPEDELRLLESEQSNPSLNPEGTAKLLQANASQQPVEDFSDGDIFDELGDLSLQEEPANGVPS